MARGRGVVAVGLACALVGCASLLSIDGSYEVGGDGGTDGPSGADAPADVARDAYDSGSSSGNAGSSSSGSNGSASSSGGSSSGVGSSGSTSSSGNNSSSSSSGGPDFEIKCANQNCKAGAQECCIVGSGMGELHTCIALGGMCTGTVMKCDDTDDCSAGQLCCGQLNQQMTGYETISCQAGCSGQLLRQFCDPNVNDCPQGMTCIPSTLLPGYYACGQ